MGERRRRRLRRKDGDRVLGQVPADAGRHSDPGPLAQRRGHGRERVGHVVRARAAGERQAAGHGGRPRRVLEVHAELARPDLHRRREARVQVEVGDVVDPHAGVAECRLGAGRESGGAAELDALAREPVVGAGGGGAREDPAVARDARVLGGLRRAGDNRGALIDLDVGVEQLEVGDRDRAVALARGHDLLGARRVGDQAWGLARATSAKRPHSRPSHCRWEAGSRPAAPRTTDSKSG